MFSMTVTRITALRIYIALAIIVNAVFSVIKPELENAYNTAGFQMMVLFLLSLL